jgi:hypothetical protein
MDKIPTPIEVKIMIEKFNEIALKEAVEHLRRQVIYNITRNVNRVGSYVFASKANNSFDYQWNAQKQAVDIVIQEMRDKGWYVTEVKRDSFTDDLFYWSATKPVEKKKSKWFWDL